MPLVSTELEPPSSLLLLCLHRVLRPCTRPPFTGAQQSTRSKSHSTSGAAVD